MPQLNKTILKDRSESPERTFVPSDIRDNVAFLAESAETPMHATELSVSLRRPKGQGAYKGLVKLVIPTVTECDGKYSVKHIIFASIEVSFPQTTTEKERNNVLGLLQSALDPKTVLINDSLVKLEGVY